MSYWKNKVLPWLKRILNKGKKKNGVVACRSFDKSKECIAKEVEEKNAELQPKVMAIYKSSRKEAKILLTAPTEAALSENSEVVQNLLIELANAGCPGAQQLSEAAAKHGLNPICQQIVFLLEKLTLFVSEEEHPVIERQIPSTCAVSKEITETSKDDLPSQVAKPEIKKLDDAAS